MNNYIDNIEKKSLTVVGIFFDGYNDLWGDFIRLYKKNWPECPYKSYIVNNSIKFDDNVFEVLNAGEDAEYSRKVQVALKNIESEYVLLLLEDFYFGEKLKEDVLEEIIEYMDKEQLDYYALSSLSSFSKYRSKVYDRSKSYLLKINHKRRYTLGCQAVIWRKSFLKKCIGTSNYNAWVFEGALTNSKNVHTREFLKGCVKDTRNVLKLKHGVLQGKMIPPTVEYFNSIGCPLEAQRGVMSDAQYKRYVLNSKIASLIPPMLHGIIKRVFRFKNENTVLDKYGIQIEQIIKENFGC